MEEACIVNGNILVNHKINKQPKHPSTSPARSSGRRSGIYQSRKPPSTPPPIVRVVRRNTNHTLWLGGPPWFRPVCADVRRWLGKCGLAAPAPLNRAAALHWLPHNPQSLNITCMFPSPIPQCRLSIPWCVGSVSMIVASHALAGGVVVYLCCVLFTDCMKEYSSSMPARAGRTGCTFVLP